MKCKKCGQELCADAEYCEFCGTFTGYEAGTVLNGKRIDTKTYTDAEPVNSRAERIFSGIGEEHSLNLNGTKNRQRTNIKGTGAQNISCRILACAGYFGWFGFVIAYLFCHNKPDPFVRFHLNAALVLNLMALSANILYSIAGIFGLIGAILAVITIVGIVIGIISAFRGTMKGIPVVTRIRLIK